MSGNNCGMLPAYHGKKYDYTIKFSNQVTRLGVEENRWNITGLEKFHEISARSNRRANCPYHKKVIVKHRIKLPLARTGMSKVLRKLAFFITL